jgi:hypothetical protein
MNVDENENLNIKIVGFHSKTIHSFSTTIVNTYLLAIKNGSAEEKMAVIL